MEEERELQNVRRCCYTMCRDRSALNGANMEILCSRVDGVSIFRVFSTVLSDLIRPHISKLAREKCSYKRSRQLFVSYSHLKESFYLSLLRLARGSLKKPISFLAVMQQKLTSNKLWLRSSVLGCGGRCREKDSISMHDQNLSLWTAE